MIIGYFSEGSILCVDCVKSRFPGVRRKEFDLLDITEHTEDDAQDNEHDTVCDDCNSVLYERNYRYA